MSCPEDLQLLQLTLWVIIVHLPPIQPHAGNPAALSSIHTYRLFLLIYFRICNKQAYQSSYQSAEIG